jgi:hypothetical protein
MAITPDLYVWTGGNNTTGASWANAYQTLADADANTSAGDVVAIASDQEQLYTSSVSLSFANDVTIISLDRSDDSYLAGAKEYQTNNGIDLNVRGVGLSLKGITIISGRNNIMADGDKIEYIDCDVSNVNTNQDLLAAPQGAILLFKGGSITTASKLFEIRDRSYQIGVTGTTVVVPSGGSVLDITSSNQNGVLNFTDCNLSGIAPTGVLMNGLNDSGVMTLRFNNCLMPTAHDGTWFPATNNASEVWVNGGNTTNDYWYFYYKNMRLGEVEADTTQYMSSGVSKYSETNYISAQFSTIARANAITPLRYKIGSFGGQDLTSAKSITVQLSSTTASLTDSNVYLEIAVQNTTNLSKVDLQSSQNADPLSTGTALSTSGVGTWVTNDIEYQITHDLGEIDNADNSTVDVYLCVGNGTEFTINADLPTIAAT